MKEKILNAVVELFAEKGFEKSLAKSIAQRAGVAEGTIFRQYTSYRFLIRRDWLIKRKDKKGYRKSNGRYKFVWFYNRICYKKILNQSILNDDEGINQIIDVFINGVGEGD